MRGNPYFREPNVCCKQVLWALALILVAFLAVGCTPSAPEPGAPGPKATVSETALPAYYDTPGPAIESRGDRLEPTMPRALPEAVVTKDDRSVTGEVPQEILDAIKTGLAASQGVAMDDIRVARAESVVWPDGSLGCPKPDEMYPQAPVKGYWVVLEVVGKQFDFRASASGNFIFCEGLRRTPPKPATPEM